jgi:hypothetical protein
MHLRFPESQGELFFQFENPATDFLLPTRSIELKENTVIVVLGASGDLAKKKTVSWFETPSSG